MQLDKDFLIRLHQGITSSYPSVKQFCSGGGGNKNSGNTLNINLAAPGYSIKSDKSGERGRGRERAREGRRRGRWRRANGLWIRSDPMQDFFWIHYQKIFFYSKAALHTVVYSRCVLFRQNILRRGEAWKNIVT